MANTIDYYNTNARKYVEETVDVNLSGIQADFLKNIPDKGYLLDFGCGSGRDTRLFLELGYKVDAMDGSKELCKQARELTGINVRQMLFQDLKVLNTYDGIWACASILHLEKAKLPSVLQRMCDALRKEGIIYASFKYGDYEGERHGRYFTDFTEDSFSRLLQQVPALNIRKQWITRDARPGRGEEKWLNLILVKADIK